MLPGVTGSLIAGTFLRDVVAARGGGAQTRAIARRWQRWWRRVESALGPASSARAVVDLAVLPLVELLGYRVVHLAPHGRGYLGALAGRGDRLVTIAAAPWQDDPARWWRDVVRASGPAATAWGLVCAGPRLRLVDARRAWSRRGLTVEIPLVLGDERAAAAAITVLQAAGDGALEGIVADSDAYGVGVCTSLGAGVLASLEVLVGALDERGRDADTHGPQEAFAQALIVVYRLLFLLFAEARGVVPTWHHVYRDAYTVEALCRVALEQPGRRGVWRAVQALSRLAHAGCRAGDLEVTPFNGRLFSPRHAPLAERARVADAAAGRAIAALATRPGSAGRERIAYADLDVEQLGAVYERVLEYEPVRAATGVVLKRSSAERKATGSFYTPRAMTDFLVRRALQPLVAGRSADEILQLRVLDPAMGSGAFLVAACRYLAGAVEQAMIAGGERPPDTRRDQRAAIRRLVAERCLYGVDVNPMAVQLARLSLWLATLAADRPLTFLDHHLATGDSLIGASLADLARMPSGRRRRRGAREPSLFALDPAPHLADRILPARFRLAREPGDTAAAIRGKEQALAGLTAPGAPLARWKAAATLWCARWFLPGDVITPGVFHDLCAALLGDHAALPAARREALLAASAAVGDARRFFHWDLEFPEVFFDRDGRRAAGAGFDAIIGNPPWEMLRADSGPRETRVRTRADRADALRFVRDAGIYAHQGGGHGNRYQLFVERALQLLRPGGRLALVLPSGLATDHGSAVLRRLLLDRLSLERLIGFDNRDGIFPIHRDVKFLLLTGTHDDGIGEVICSLGHSDPAWLDGLPDRARDDPPDARTVTLTRSLIDRWDPQHLRWPLLSSAADLDIVASIAARVPPLGGGEGWQAVFGRELNATDDRPHFAPLRPPLLPVIEGKHLEPFRVGHRSTQGIARARAAALVDPARTFGRRRLAYRDVASATNRLTLIAAIVPADIVTTHTVFCLKTPLGDEAQYCLLALLNSLVANYLVRLQVTTHVSAGVMANLRVPRPAAGSGPFRTLAAAARRLERSGLGEGEAAYVRLNTAAARLYGLTAAQYRHLLTTFPLLPASLRARCAENYSRDL